MSNQCISIVVKNDDSILLVNDGYSNSWDIPRIEIDDIGCVEPLIIKQLTKLELDCDCLKIEYLLQKVYTYNCRDSVINVCQDVCNSEIMHYAFVYDISPNKNICADKCKWASIEDIFNCKQINYFDSLIPAFTAAEKIIRANIGIDKTLEGITQFYENLGFSVQTINFTNNSINGLISESNKKYFFKIGSIQDIYQEIRGYFTIKNEYPVPPIYEIILLNEDIILIYYYEESISTDSGTLSDYINDCTQNNYQLSSEQINNILCIYKHNLHHTKISNAAPIDLFYRERKDTRIIPWYLKNDEFLRILKYNTSINGKAAEVPYDTINDCNCYFSEDRNLTCFLCQGDPNELNIGMKPIFFDFQTSGYNPIAAEFAILFWSLYLAGGYFYPKYHEAAYRMHKNIVKNVCLHKPDIKYSIDHIQKQIRIELNYKPNYARGQVLKNYLEVFRQDSLLDELNKNLKFHLIYRVIGTLNILQMEETDMVMSLAFMLIFNHDSSNYMDYLLSIIDKGV